MPYFAQVAARCATVKSRIVECRKPAWCSPGRIGQWPFSHRSVVPGRRFLAADSGGAAAEFAIVLPILSLCIFSIIGFSSFLYTQNNMVNAAREAVRQMAVVEAPYSSGAISCGTDEAAILGSAEYVACNYLTFWGSNFIIDASTDCPLEDKATVRIVANASQAALTDIFGFFTGKLLSVEVSMRKEDPCA